LPEEWKELIIEPARNSGDKTEFSNFGGVSLVPITYKILSNILSSRVTLYAEEILGILIVDFDAAKICPTYFLLGMVSIKEMLFRRCFSTLL